MLYWIEYTNGITKVFEAKDKASALHYFMMEGDHAHNYGSTDNEYTIEVEVLSNKNAVGQTIARHKSKPPNCS